MNIESKKNFMKVPQFDPVLAEEDICCMMETLRANWITEGEKTAALQGILQESCGVKHAILLPNGTLAIFAALKVLGLGPGDEVLVPDFTFIASATAVVLAGAKPVFIEVGLDDFNVAVDFVEDAITEKTRAIMPVHVYGQAANMPAILKVARRHNLKVIEDAAQGIGVTYQKQHVGTFGDIGCISFFADKTITTGEGGAVLLNDDELANEVRYFKNQGRLERGSFVHPRLGYNFRITDLQAALAVNQMKRLASIIERKNANETLYKKHLDGIREVEFPKANGYGRRVPFRVNILVPDPEALMKHLDTRGVGTRRFFYPLHKQPCFNRENSGAAPRLENAAKIFERGVSLPSGLSLSESEIQYVCESIREFYGS
jgi:perosamine synthetase